MVIHSSFLLGVHYEWFSISYLYRVEITNGYSLVIRVRCKYRMVCHSPFFSGVNTEWFVIRYTYRDEIIV